MRFTSTTRRTSFQAVSSRKRRFSRSIRSIPIRRKFSRAFALPPEEEERDGATGSRNDDEARRVEAKLAAEVAALQFLAPSKMKLGDQMRLALSLLTSSAGIAGTVAVVLAFCVQLDPFGNFHWDGRDISIGFLFLLPLLLSDAFLMIPDWSSMVEKETRSPFMAGFVPEPSSDTSNGNKKGLAWASALSLVQSQYVLENPAKDLYVPIEVFVIVVSHIAQEMLVRATILQGLSVWIKDRILETYMWLDEDTVINLGIMHSNPKNLANFLALSFTLAAGIYTRRKALFGSKGFSKKEMEAMMDMKEELERRRLQQQRISKLTSGNATAPQDPSANSANEELSDLETFIDGKTVIISSKAKEKMKKGALDPADVRNSIEQVSRSIDTSFRLNAMRDILRWITFSGAWFATGNLATTILMSFIEDGLFSTYQRVGWMRLRQKKAKNLEVQLRRIRDIVVKNSESDHGELEQSEAAEESPEVTEGRSLGEDNVSDSKED